MDDIMDSYLSDSALINKLSDITRVIDPVKKQVIKYKNNEKADDKIHCFDFWGKNKVCDNCISMRAYHDNTTYVKIEYNKDKTYMVTAIPIELENRRIVIEVLKDITNSMYFEADTAGGLEKSGIHALIDNMNKLAFTDPLTGVYNRRYILEKLPVDLINAALLQQDISLIMADIDHFKAVNDKYGHLAGDYTLKKVAATLSGCMKRSSDWLARYGGEEFLTCMPGADLETAKATAECMRKSLEDIYIDYDDKRFNVSASFGICHIKPAGSENIDDLIKQADEKLYLAKKNGRNRVEY